MMIGKLVALIEDHADELTARMVRLVRLFCPSDPNDFLDLPVTMLKEVEEDS